jgi:hypothetical protein
MKQSAQYRINKFLARFMGMPRPEIRWDDITRIEAFGTDAVSAFAIMVTFHYSDGTSVSVHPEHKGYCDIVESLGRRFPSISPDWFEQMQAAGREPFDVERVLYVRPEGAQE